MFYSHQKTEISLEKYVIFFIFFLPLGSFPKKVPANTDEKVTCEFPLIWRETPTMSILPQGSAVSQ